MARWLDHLKQNIRGKVFSSKKEGASLVSVVIGVVFLAAIGLTVLTVATRYIINVVADRETTDNFYQTEGILSELRTGLLEKAGDSAETAYTDIFEHYTDTSYTTSMKEKFSKEYLTGIATSLLESGTYTWDDSKLGVSQVGSIDKLKKMTRVPDAVETVDTRAGGDLHFVINKTTDIGYTLTIKDLVIDYTDDSGYRSSIHTDMVFKVPDYKFEGDSTFEELKKYIVINDDMLQFSAANIGATMEGNIYTGKEDTGIQVDSQNKVTFNSPKIISRGSFDAFTGASVDIAGEGSTAGDLYLQNIRLKKSADKKSALETKFTMNANAYISNDLDIESNHTTVTMSGKYYGYSYNQQNEASGSGRSNADYSSAILVNGVNTTLNAGNLSKMILAGRAYVSQNDSTGASVNSEIIMGESLAPKSNQLAYLVPDAYIKSDHNPVLTNEYQASDVDKTNLLKDLGTYLDSNNPVKENYHSAGYVYLFLNFKNEQSANQYFEDYYTDNIQTSSNSTVLDDDSTKLAGKEDLRTKAITYLAATNLTNTFFSGNLYLIAGNILYNYDATNGKDGMQSANYYDGSDPNAELLADGKKMALNYLGNCLTLLPGGSAGRDSNIRLEADDFTSRALVATKIIDFSNLTSNITRTALETNTAGSIIVSKGDYVVGSDTTGLLICDGDVTVSADFTGLILANGKVTVNGDRDLKYDMILVGNLLEYIKTDDELSKLFWALNGRGAQNDTMLEQCVYYQNWEKNAY